MSSAASKAALEQLHTKVAEALSEALKTTGEGGPSAAILNVARQFLKDNGIDAPALPGTPTGAVAEKMKDYPFNPADEMRQH